jgi:hypothetical protein
MASMVLCRGWMVERMEYPPPMLYQAPEEQGAGRGGGGGGGPCCDLIWKIQILWICMCIFVLIVRLLPSPSPAVEPPEVYN